MTRRLIILISLLVLVTAAALAIPMALLVSNDQRSAFISNLERDALAAAMELSAQPEFDWQATTELVADRTGARVIAVDYDRNLQADSTGSEVDRSFDRVELDAALKGELASDVRYSETLQDELRYVAAPIVQNYQVVGAVRLSLSESAVEREIATTQMWLALFVVSVVIVAALTAWLLARSVTAPLRALATTARELPNDLSLRANTGGPTEVAAVADALNSTADKLSNLIARTQRVAADASHHLRTPLTGIRLRLEAISDISDDDEVRGQADAAMNEVDRLTHRIEQVLDLAKTDAGSAPRAEVDLGVVVAERVEAARSWGDGVRMEFDVDASGSCVVSTPVGLPAKVIDELLGNAHAYARSRIDVSVERRGPMCVLTVADDGPGVPAEERASVFERFHRGTGAAVGGSGLGLALVREAAQACGGDARIEESKSGGAAVVVTFPCVAGGSTSAE